MNTAPRAPGSQRDGSLYSCRGIWIYLSLWVFLNYVFKIIQMRIMLFRKVSTYGNTLVLLLTEATLLDTCSVESARPLSQSPVRPVRFCRATGAGKLFIPLSCVMTVTVQLAVFKAKPSFLIVVPWTLGAMYSVWCAACPLGSVAYRFFTMLCCKILSYLLLPGAV